MATDRSDLDVYVVLADADADAEPDAEPDADAEPVDAAEADAHAGTRHPTAIDETVLTISDLERVPPFGTNGWWYRWSFAWAPVLFDRTGGGRLASALRRQATVTPVEAEAILIDHVRLGGWLNYAYRALKSHRDGHLLESRLDAAESMPWLLDVIFTLEGRVRPYHKYLPWELRRHPLTHWRTEELLTLLTATLDGDPSAIRTTFARIETLCAAFDSGRPSPILTPVLDGWGNSLGQYQKGRCTRPLRSPA